MNTDMVATISTNKNENCTTVHQAFLCQVSAGSDNFNLGFLDLATNNLTNTDCSSNSASDASLTIHKTQSHVQITNEVYVDSDLDLSTLNGIQQLLQGQ